MAIQGMRFSDQQPAETIDVTEFYNALSEAHRRRQSVRVKPAPGALKLQSEEPITAPESYRNLIKAKELHVVQQRERNRNLTLADLEPPLQGAAMGPVKLAGIYPDLAGQDTDVLLYDVFGASPSRNEMIDFKLDQLTSALSALSAKLE